MQIKFKLNIFLLSAILLVGTTLHGQTDVKIKKDNFAVEDEGLQEAWKSVRKGNQFFKQGESFYPEARALYLKAIRYNSENAELNYKLGVCYLFTDNKYEAIKYLRKAFQLKPNVAPDIQLMLGKAYQLVVDFDAAIGAYEKYKVQVTDAAKLQVVRRSIEECQNGKELMKIPNRVIINNLGNKVNSKYDDYSPVVFNSEKTMFYCSKRPIDEKNERSMVNNKFFEDVYKSNKIDNIWQTGSREFGKILDDKKNKSNNVIVYASQKGDVLYLYQGSKGNGDIYRMVLKSKGKWKSPKKVKEINTKNIETTCSLSSDGNTLYYISSNPSNSRGKKDIFYIKKNSKDRWGKPVNLSPSVNSAYDEECVNISEDGKTLFFSSKGHNSMGGYDVYKTELDSMGVWSNPKNLGYPINTPDDDMFYQSIGKGNYAYYSTIRESGIGLKDIYKIIYLGEEKELLTSEEIIPIAGVLHPRPDIYFTLSQPVEIDQSILLSGKVIDAKSGSGVKSKIEIIDLDANNIIVTTLSAEDGAFRARLPEKKNFGIEISSTDYLLLLDVLDIINDPNDEEIAREFKLQKVEVGQSVVLDNIFFETGKETLKPESYASLNEVAKLMENNPSLKIEISGHTDNVGSLKTNQKLSENRAKSVVDYLGAQGISKSRLTYVGFGEEKPIAPNTTEEGRASNRRVEFKILSK